MRFSGLTIVTLGSTPAFITETFKASIQIKTAAPVETGIDISLTFIDIYKHISKIVSEQRITDHAEILISMND